jgi:hypothetical protein
MDEAIFCLDFTHGSFKKPTGICNDPSEETKKRQVIFDQTDEANILEVIKDAAPALLNMEDVELPLLMDACTHIFQSTSNLTSKKNPKRK